MVWPWPFLFLWRIKQGYNVLCVLPQAHKEELWLSTVSQGLAHTLRIFYTPHHDCTPVSGTNSIKDGYYRFQTGSEEEGLLDYVQKSQNPQHNPQQCGACDPLPALRLKSKFLSQGHSAQRHGATQSIRISALWGRTSIWKASSLHWLGSLDRQYNLPMPQLLPLEGASMKY